MTRMEQRSAIEKTRADILKMLKEKYPFKWKSELGKEYLNNKHGIGFCVDIIFSEEYCLVIEYDDTWEDGDCFFPSDYKTISDMCSDMMREIDNAEPDPYVNYSKDK